MKKYSQPLNIIFLGRSGSGKGTQLRLLQKRIPLLEVDTGALLREFIKKEKNQFTDNISQIMTKGNLVPSWFAIYTWLSEVISAPLDKGLAFEGSPRTLFEAKALHEALRLAGRKRLKVVYVNVPAKEVKKRLLARRICSRCGKEYSLLLTPGLKKCTVCGGKLIRRADDTPKAITARMEFFRKYIIPVIRYFRKQKILVEVNGVGPIEEIQQRILKKLHL